VRDGAAAAHVPIVAASIVIAFAGLALAAWCFRDLRRAARMRERFASAHRVLSGKYFVDEIYDALIGRPLVWLSDRVFLRLGDRVLLDGTLDGMATAARRGAQGLARMQAGPLQLYALFAVIGIVLALAWMLGHV
jgi:NADH-quinone oxidoreductase subunit L